MAENEEVKTEDMVRGIVALAELNGLDVEAVDGCRWRMSMPVLGLLIGSIQGGIDVLQRLNPIESINREMTEVAQGALKANSNGLEGASRDDGKWELTVADLIQLASYAQGKTSAHRSVVVPQSAVEWAQEMVADGRPASREQVDAVLVNATFEGLSVLRRRRHMMQPEAPDDWVQQALTKASSQLLEVWRAPTSDGKHALSTPHLAQHVYGLMATLVLGQLIGPGDADREVLLACEAALSALSGSLEGTSDQAACLHQLTDKDLIAVTMHVYEQLGTFLLVPDMVQHRAAELSQDSRVYSLGSPRWSHQQQVDSTLRSALFAGIRELERKRLEAMPEHVLDEQDVRLVESVVCRCAHLVREPKYVQAMFNLTFPVGSEVYARGRRATVKSEARIAPTGKVLVTVQFHRDESASEYDESVLIAEVFGRASGGHAESSGPPVMAPGQVCSRCGAPLDRATAGWSHNGKYWEHECPLHQVK